MKRIVLCGKGGSGKTTLSTDLQELGLRLNKSVTSRTKRSDESEEAYNFVSEGDFVRMKEEGSFYEYKKFNNTFYGTTKNNWVSKQVFIMVPKGIKQITKKDRKNTLVVYLDVDENTLCERMIKRGDDIEEIRRRLQVDAQDFKGFTDYDMRITDPGIIDYQFKKYLCTILK